MANISVFGLTFNFQLFTNLLSWSIKTDANFSVISVTHSVLLSMQRFRDLISRVFRCKLFRILWILRLHVNLNCIIFQILLNWLISIYQKQILWIFFNFWISSFLNRKTFLLVKDVWVESNSVHHFLSKSKNKTTFVCLYFSQGKFSQKNIFQTKFKNQTIFLGISCW